LAAVFLRLYLSFISTLLMTIPYDNLVCHPERSRGISLVYCLSHFTLQFCMRSFGSLHSLRMTGLSVIPQPPKYFSEAM